MKLCDTTLKFRFLYYYYCCELYYNYPTAIFSEVSVCAVLALKICPVSVTQKTLSSFELTQSDKQTVCSSISLG